ncbi:MAG TPA: UrcA family protein [Steroidobacteraceae bacterium]|nr:UrcA family protein [Steroidobacteraceae bacterium]
MKTRRTLRGVGSALLLGGLCLTAAAFADNLPTITIGAGVVTKTAVGHSSLGAPLEQVSITHRVSYSDLDLTTVVGATELKQRVKEAAKMACKQLDDLYPLEAKNVNECTRTAIAQASSQVDSAISGAIREAKAE